MESYLTTSIVEKAVETIDYNEVSHRDLDFLYLGKWHYIPKKWFADPSYYPDLFFDEVGRGIAVGEEKHIVDKLLANGEVQRISLDTINYGVIRDAFHQLATELERPHPTLRFVLFAPIEYYVKMHTDWAREQQRLLMVDRRLVVDSFRVNVFWSSRYIDYKEFVVSERSLCHWIAKPNVRNRLEVRIAESEKPESMELKAQTIFRFALHEPQKIRVLTPTHSPET